MNKSLRCGNPLKVSSALCAFLSFFVLLETQLNSFFRSVTHSLHLVSQDSHQLENSTEVKKKCLDGH